MQGSRLVSRTVVKRIDADAARIADAAAADIAADSPDAVAAAASAVAWRPSAQLRRPDESSRWLGATSCDLRIPPPVASPEG